MKSLAQSKIISSYSIELFSITQSEEEQSHSSEESIFEQADASMNELSFSELIEKDIEDIASILTGQSTQQHKLSCHEDELVKNALILIQKKNQEKSLYENLTMKKIQYGLKELKQRSCNKDSMKCRRKTLKKLKEKKLSITTSQIFFQERRNKTLQAIIDTSTKIDYYQEELKDYRMVMNYGASSSEEDDKQENAPIAHNTKPTKKQIKEEKKLVKQQLSTKTRKIQQKQKANSCRQLNLHVAFSKLGPSNRRQNDEVFEGRNQPMSIAKSEWLKSGKVTRKDADQEMFIRKRQPNRTEKSRALEYQQKAVQGPRLRDVQNFRFTCKKKTIGKVCGDRDSFRQS